MARIVMVEFEDNNEADRFVAKLTSDQMALKSRRAIGLFPTPTKFCECNHAPRGSARMGSPWGRTEKFGWWVCTTCKKAQKGWQSPKNLLQPKLVTVADNTFWIHIRAGDDFANMTSSAEEGNVSFFTFPDHQLGDKFPTHLPRNASSY